jgi:hypothetical protein
MAVRRETTQQRGRKARRSSPIGRATQLVQTAARQAAAGQNAIDLGKSQWQDRPIGRPAVIEPGEPDAQLVEQQLFGDGMRG